jgi:hypothetical protein
MKRISILVAIVALAPAVSQASHCSSERYLLRYSPYAFNYHNSGLIPGGIKYSPYAFNPNSTGLVYEGARYTPYAFNYHSSGLVIDYYWWQTPYCPPCRVVESCSAPQRSAPASHARRRAVASRGPSASTRKLQEIRETDGEQIVRRYLQAQGLDDVRIDRRLSIENRTAGAAFILRDKNLVVRYTNPQIMESLEAEGGSRMKVVQRYEENWETFVEDFEARGGTVYCVDASEPDQIVAALAACEELSPDRLSEQTMVAKELK